MMSTHRIQRHIWVVQLPSHPSSWAIKNTLSQLTRTQLWPRLALLCDKLTDPDRLYCLERLELDIGVIELPQWASSLMEQVAAAFAQALEEQLQQAHRYLDKSGRPAVIEWDKNAQARRTLDAFLKTGRRPWWAHQDEKTLFTLCLSQLINHAPQALCKMLREYLTQPACLQRLITHCADRQLWALSQLLMPAGDNDLARGGQRLQTTLRRAFTDGHFNALTLRHAYWQAILLTCAERNQNILDKETFFKQSLLHLATHGQLQSRYLLVHLFSLLTPKEKTLSPWSLLLPSEPPPPERFTEQKEDHESVYSQLLAQLQTLRGGCLSETRQMIGADWPGVRRDVFPIPRLIRDIERLMDTLKAHRPSGEKKLHQRLLNQFNRFQKTVNESAAHLGLHRAKTFSDWPYQSLVTLGETLSQLKTGHLVPGHHESLLQLQHQIAAALSSNQIHSSLPAVNISAFMAKLKLLLEGLQQAIEPAQRKAEPNTRTGLIENQRETGGKEREKRTSLASLRTLHRRLCQQYQTLKKQTVFGTDIVPNVTGLASESVPLKPLMAMITTLAVVLKKQRHRAQHARGKPFLPPQLAHESEVQRSEEIDIDNAGLILLGPFLKPFFTHTRLLQDDHFLDGEAAQRAVLLLQYLITPQSTFFESALPLNKLLCGLDIQESIENPTFTVSLLEQSACRHLFEQIAEQWPVMARMSRHYLIQHFLRRRGVIRNNGHHWRLQVERTTHDVLMTGTPWPMRHLDLPWFNQPIQVEW